MQKHTLTPEWDEDLYVMVQEPKTQSLRVQMFDRDLLNVKACALHETCHCQLSSHPNAARARSSSFAPSLTLGTLLISVAV